MTLRAVSSGGGRSFVERARALESRAGARGGVLVGWDGAQVSFAFDGGALADVVAIACSPGEDTMPGEPEWSAGIAQGALRLVYDDGTRGDLSWGPALMVSSLLATHARPGEVLSAENVRGVDTELLAARRRVVREGGVRVRAVRIDRAQPWRAKATEALARMRVPRILGADPMELALEAGRLQVVRADPGVGGSRFLAEVAARSPRSLVMSPSGSGLEPLGALRRALAGSISRDLNPLLLELAPSLESLLAGEGVGLDVAARLISAFFWRKSASGTPAVLAIDDARDVDPASLDAAVRALGVDGARFALVARLDASSGLPSRLASVEAAPDVELGTMSHELSEELCAACTNELMVPVARRRWSKLGGGVPLGIIEAVAFGTTTGELRWMADDARPRDRAAGRGKTRGAGDWILMRAQMESKDERALLCLVALLGGEAKIARLGRILTGAGLAFDVDQAVARLMGGRWLVDTQEDWIGLPSRTHVHALRDLFEADLRGRLHAAAAEIIEAEEGALGRAEAAQHALLGGAPDKAAKIALAAAKVASAAELEASVTRLIGFARRADPSCEDEARAQLATAMARTPSVPPTTARSAPPMTARSAPPASADMHDSEPPTLAKLDLPPMAIPDTLGLTASSPPPGAVDEDGPGSQIANRLTELAKDALLGADNAALERWVDGLRATGDSPVFTERMRALARLGRGDIGDALRVLRRARQAMAPDDSSLRCQTSLALGFALSVAGRSEEALLEGLDALARARQAGDEAGAKACLAFLAKLYATVDRMTDAKRLWKAGRVGDRAVKA